MVFLACVKCWNITSCCHLSSSLRCFLPHLPNLSNSGSATPPMRLFPTATVVSEVQQVTAAPAVFRESFHRTRSGRAGERASAVPAVGAAEVWGGDGDGDRVGTERATTSGYGFLPVLCVFSSCVSVAPELSVPMQLFLSESQT